MKRMLHVRAHSPLRATEYTTRLDREMQEVVRNKTLAPERWVRSGRRRVERNEKLESLGELFCKERLRSLRLPRMLFATTPIAVQRSSRRGG